MRPARTVLAIVCLMLCTGRPSCSKTHLLWCERGNVPHSTDVPSVHQLYQAMGTANNDKQQVHYKCFPQTIS